MHDGQNPAVALREALEQIRADWDEPLAPLRAVRAGVGGGRSYGASSPSPVPVALSDARLDVAASLLGWCAVLIEDRRLEHAGARQDDVPGMCALLARHADWWAQHEAWPDMMDEIDHLARRLHRHACPDRSHTVRIGACPLEDESGVRCEGRVIADPETWDATCTHCRERADIAWWRERILVASYVTIRELAQLTAVMGVPMSVEAIRTAADRGAIEVAGRDARGRRLFDRTAALGALEARRRAA